MMELDINRLGKIVREELDKQKDGFPMKTGVGSYGMISDIEYEVTLTGSDQGQVAVSLDLPREGGPDTNISSVICRFGFTPDYSGRVFVASELADKRLELNDRAYANFAEQLAQTMNFPSNFQGMVAYLQAPKRA